MLTNPSLLYLKYKGIPTPSEVEKNAKNVGFKCLKYSKWTDVCVDENTPSILKEIGSSLIDDATFPKEHYATFSIVWERLRRWSKDKENFAIEPDQYPEFERLSRIVHLGCHEPSVVDSFLEDNGIECEKLDLDQRWVSFQALCLALYFTDSKRFKDQELVHQIKIGQAGWIDRTSAVTALAYDSIGLEFEDGTDPEGIIRCLYDDLSLPVDPEKTERSLSSTTSKRPNVWVDFKELGFSSLVNFKVSEGDIVVDVNKHHLALQKENQFSETFSDPKFWEIIGMAAKNNVVHLDTIQNFFDDFSKYYRLKVH